MAITTPVDKQNRFMELLEQHRGIVGKVARTYCWHSDDRDELSQEIITRLWRAFSSYEDMQLFSTWMYRVALNVSISRVRRNSIRRSSFQSRYHSPMSGTRLTLERSDYVGGDPSSIKEARLWLHPFAGH